MSATAIACPACGTELTLEHLAGSLDDEQAFASLLALSVPIAPLVVHYCGLFTPDKQRLTLRKKVRLIAQLLPDLRRETINHKGRDWPAPHAHWGRAIEQMLAARAAGRLALPLSGHGYLYAVLAGLADKQEAQAEQQRENERRNAPASPASATASATAGASAFASPAAAALQDPALAALAAHHGSAVPMPDQARALLAQLKQGTLP